MNETLLLSDLTDLCQSELLRKPSRAAMDRVNLSFSLCQVLVKAGKLAATIDCDSDGVASGTGKGFYPVTIAGKAVHVYDPGTVVYVTSRNKMCLSQALSDTGVAFVLGFDLDTVPYTFYLPVLKHDTLIRTFLSIYDGVLYATGQVQKRLAFQRELESVVTPQRNLI